VKHIQGKKNNMAEAEEETDGKTHLESKLTQTEISFPSVNNNLTSLKMRTAITRAQTKLQQQQTTTTQSTDDKMHTLIPRGKEVNNVKPIAQLSGENLDKIIPFDMDDSRKSLLAQPLLG